MTAKNYQARVLSEARTIGINLVCDNDDEAKAKARELAKGNVVDLWDGSGTRWIASFNPERN
jgi:hypothetical protein